MTIVATVLETYRPDLLAATLDGSRDILRACDSVIMFCNGGDAESMAAMDACGVDHERLVRTCEPADVLPNGPATTACALAAKKSGCDLWIHLEGDWLLVPELVAQLPDWFDVAIDIASNPAIGQVRLREETHLGQLVTLPDGLHGDGSGAANINWVDGRPVPWRVMPDAPFMVSNAHLTWNPMIMRTELIGTGVPEKPGEPIRGVFPAETERHAMARFYAANLLVAQLRPGVYRHIGEGRHSGQH
jgi:hypothetical protein